MILKFPGGVRPLRRTQYAKQAIKNIDKCSVICIAAENGAVASIAAGTAVKRGSLLGENAQTPVYSSISGIFRGIATIEGDRYFVVTADKKNATNVEERIYDPETRSLTELTREDIIESAKKFAIIDSRSGQPLWKLLSVVGNGCRRLVIDCTESDSESAINYRLCLEKASLIVGGAKVLLQATGALKCVFAGEYYRTPEFEKLAEYATDEKIFAIAKLDEKYPYSDRTLMYALYVKTLEEKQTALDMGVLIVSPETVIALYNAMISGMPQLDRYISVCFNDTAKGGNLCVPRGITLHDITEFCGGLDKEHFFVKNSLLSGRQTGGALSDSTRVLVSAKAQKIVRTTCISCGRCVDACPVRLVPNEVLIESNRSKLKKYCVSCGACEFICPSGIPLLSLIRDTSDKEQEA